MSPAHSAATAAKTSRQSSKKSSASQSRKPPVLKCLKRAGQHGEATTTAWEDDGAWLGECMTRNTGESPNAAVASRLSQILEETPQEKYRLSAKACQGILRRAERRGKDLPERLKAVLTQQSQEASPQEQTEAPAQTEAPTSYAVRIRGGCDGGGKGALVQIDRSGTLGTGNDQTIFCLQGNGIDRADTAGCNGKGFREDVSYTLNTIDRPAVTAYSFDSLASNSMKSANPNSGCRAVEVAKTIDTSCPDPSKNQGGVCILDMTHACDVIRECGDVVPSLQARMGTGGNQIPLTYAKQKLGEYKESAQASTCAARDYKDSTDLVVSDDVSPALRAKSADPHREDMMAYVTSVDCRNFCEGGETNGTPQAKSTGGQSVNLQNTVRTGMVVRRLTPLECERLQGYPDGWTDIGEWRDSKGKLHKDADSPRYKACGNSIALPFWLFLAKRISAQYLRPVTMGSLFDGIGGFPLVFELCNGKGTARWASEIEEFPIAVTKLRFGKE